MSRAPISAPAPGPNGMMKRTGCCGQACVWACAGGADKARMTARATTGMESLDISRTSWAARHRERYRFGSVAQRSLPRLLEAGKTDLHGADGVDLECNRILAQFDCNRRHHRAGDDDFSAAQPLAESVKHIRNVAHDVDPLAGIGLRIAGASELAP